VVATEPFDLEQHHASDDEVLALISALNRELEDRYPDG
jgi:hypothetical protein